MFCGMGLVDNGLIEVLNKFFEPLSDFLVELEVKLNLMVKLFKLRVSLSQNSDVFAFGEPEVFGFDPLEVDCNLLVKSSVLIG